MVCGSPNAVEYVDFDVDEEFYGRFYICLKRDESDMSCAEDMFRLLPTDKVVSKVEFDKVKTQLEFTESENTRLHDNLSFFNNAIVTAINEHNNVVPNDVTKESTAGPSRTDTSVSGTA